MKRRKPYNTKIRQMNLTEIESDMTEREQGTRDYAWGWHPGTSWIICIYHSPCEKPLLPLVVIFKTRSRMTSCFGPKPRFLDSEARSLKTPLRKRVRDVRTSSPSGRQILVVVGKVESAIHAFWPKRMAFPSRSSCPRSPHGTCGIEWNML